MRVDGRKISWLVFFSYVIWAPSYGASRDSSTTWEEDMPILKPSLSSGEGTLPESVPPLRISAMDRLLPASSKTTARTSAMNMTSVVIFPQVLAVPTKIAEYHLDKLWLFDPSITTAPVFNEGESERAYEDAKTFTAWLKKEKKFLFVYMKRWMPKDEKVDTQKALWYTINYYLVKHFLAKIEDGKQDYVKKVAQLIVNSFVKVYSTPPIVEV